MAHTPLPFHAQSCHEVLKHFNVRQEQGLPPKEVRQRRKTYGPNRLKAGKTRSSWQILGDQFKSIVFLVLAVAAVLAFSLGHLAEGVAVGAVLLVNGCIGYFSEWQAVRSMAALKKIGQPQTRVRRKGSSTQIPITTIVPGDIVLLEGGDIVPADLRVLEANQLQVDESALTGESVAVAKTIDPMEMTCVLADRKNLLFKGTTVTSGSAEGVVIATGMDTELGRISELVEGAEEEVTPLERRLDRLGQRLAMVAVGLSGIIAGVGFLVGHPVYQMIETAIALGLAAIPEGLPIVATIALARGMWLMAQRHALINRLAAVETLGATRVIFTDKTGTLTANQMTAQKIVTPQGEFRLPADSEPKGSLSSDIPQESGERPTPLLRRILEIGVLCNNASLVPSPLGADEQEAHGDPTEVALLRAGLLFQICKENLLREKPELREVAFNTDVKMMATFHQGQDAVEVAVKGAPQAVLDCCDAIVGKDGVSVHPLHQEDRRIWTEHIQSLASQAFRVLGVAEKTVTSDQEEPYQSLRFLGLIGLMDPPRSGIREAITSCQNAGIRVIMVTGDQPETGQAIAHQVGLTDSATSLVMTGDILKDPERLSSEERTRILNTEVFARVNPEQKLNLVRIFQQEGEVVAMTGDGINDAPALKKADIGVAMGKRGTEAAKEAADMILKDDAFSSIVAAVEQGRIIFNNIRRSLLFMLCTNLAGIVIVALATLAKAPLPLKPLQILYLNVLTDVFPALALGVGTGSQEVMTQPPRPISEPVLTRSHWLAIGGWSVLIAASVLGALTFALVWLGRDPHYAVTISFLTLAFAKLGFVFNLRDPASVLWQNDIVKNLWIWGAMVLCTCLLVLAVYLPGLSTVLQTQPLDRTGWETVMIFAIIPLLVGQCILIWQSRQLRANQPSNVQCGQKRWKK